MCDCSKSRVTVRNLEVHDTVFLAGRETTERDGVFSLSFMGESDTLFGEIMEASESDKPGKIKMRVATVKASYLLDVERTQEFLKISPQLLTAAEIKAGSKIILRGEAAPEELGGKPSHTDLVRSHGAVADVLKVKTLRDGCLQLIVLLGRKRRFKFVVESKRVLEVF